MKKTGQSIISEKQLKSGKRLRERRERLKEKYADRNGIGIFTQRYVSKILNVSVSAISKHEKGYLCPSLDQYFIYCKIYDCDMNYLTGMTDEWKPYPKEKDQTVYQE